MPIVSFPWGYIFCPQSQWFASHWCSIIMFGHSKQNPYNLVVKAAVWIWMFVTGWRLMERQKNSEGKRDWAVLLLTPLLVWKHYFPCQMASPIPLFLISRTHASPSSYFSAFLFLPLGLGSPVCSLWPSPNGSLSCCPFRIHLWLQSPHSHRLREWAFRSDCSTSLSYIQTSLSSR